MYDISNLIISRPCEGATGSPTQEFHQLPSSRLRGRAFAVNEAASDTKLSKRGLTLRQAIVLAKLCERSQRRLTHARFQRRSPHPCTIFPAPHPLQKYPRRRPFRTSTTRQDTGLTYSQIGPSLTYERGAGRKAAANALNDAASRGGFGEHVPSSSSRLPR